MMNLGIPLWTVALAAIAVLLLPVRALAEGAGNPKGAAAAGSSIDYAKSAHVDDWLRHPVYGDPSFDSFKRLPGNPILRGEGEFAWPVNGYLFLDTKSPNWYVYVGTTEPDTP